MTLNQREPNQKGGGCYVKEAASIDGPTPRIKSMSAAATAQSLRLQKDWNFLTHTRERHIVFIASPSKQLVGVWIPAGMLQQLDYVIKSTGRYPNRAEAIRMAIHDLIRTEGRVSS